MKSRVMSTDAGTFILEFPTAEILAILAKWPEGIQVKTGDEQPTIEITLGNQNYEVEGLSMNLIGFSRSVSAVSVFQRLRVLLPFAIQGVVKDFRGILLPCAYAHDYEAGYLLFGRTFEEPSFLQKYRALKGFDTLFGVGGHSMVATFLRGAVEACRMVNLEPQVDFGVATRSVCEKSAFDFVIAGENLIYLQPEVREADDVWKAFVAAGFDEVFHLPASLPRPFST